jgi:hypothetical protein
VLAQALLPELALSARRLSALTWRLGRQPCSWRLFRQPLRFPCGRNARIPGVWALPMGSGDVLTALFALPAAIAVATGTAQGRKATIAWNIFGLADFAMAITLGFITSPGSLQLTVPDVPSIGTGAGVLTPAFVVPSSILLPALSLRQLIRRCAG